jgi:hypothetical protein
MRTASKISSVRFHHPPGTQENTTRRNEFDPRSMTASRSGASPSGATGAATAPRTAR